MASIAWDTNPDLPDPFNPFGSQRMGVCVEG
jgi:hypothetical protein